MGCFGDMTPTKQVDQNTTSTVSPPGWAQAAGEANYNLARSVLDAGYEPYTAARVAPLSGNEKMASNMVASKAAAGNPWEGQAAENFTGYGAAPGYKYNFNTVTDPNGPLGPMSGYMDPYLDSVLAPMLRQLGTSGAQARMGINANATNAGAYGDARHGVVESEQRNNQALQETDTVGRAWSQAFNTAMGLRGQDASREFQTQQAQAGADKDALERMRTSGIDLTNLDKYGVSRDLGLASALGQTGAIGRGVEQAGMDAGFEEHLRKTGWTQQQVAFLTSLLKGTPMASTTTGTKQETTSQPDNSGWQAIGTLAPLAASLLI